VSVRHGRDHDAPIMDDRRRCLALALGNSVLLLIVWISLLIQEDIVDGNSGRNLHLESFFQLSVVIVVLSFILYLGPTGLKKVLGFALQGYDFATNRSISESLRSRIQRWAQTQIPAQSLCHAIMLRVLVLAMSAALYFLVHDNGGLKSSPYLQFAITMFIAGALLSEKAGGRLFIAAAAFLLLAVIYVTDQDALAISFSSGYIAVVTGLNAAVAAFIVVVGGGVKEETPAA
jgi:hypothetical protein